MWALLILCFLAGCFAQNTEPLAEFTPVVTATCKTGLMSIKIKLNQPFNGLAHARQFRTPSCMAYGDGTDELTLDINLMAPVGSADYCGLLVNNRTDERSVPLAVRIHRTLELADDKFYIITCGNGFQNSFNTTSTVSLRLLNDKGHKVMNAAFGLAYTLKAEIVNPDGLHGIKMKDCNAFNMKNTSVPLLDNRGCPVHSSLSLPTQGVSETEFVIKSMFRFPNTSQVSFQCEIIICRGRCAQPDCHGDKEPNNDVIESTYTVSTGAFVLDPTDSAVVAIACQEGGIRPPWLLYLTIALGVMFLIMLLINCFLCTAMTCSCARTEVLEKDPSVVEDYDPYRSWHGSQYGSRYPSSTIHSARSVSDNSDHYAIVQSRPGSRHSGMHRSRH